MANLKQEEGLRVIAQATEQLLEQLYGQKMGFCLVVCPFNQERSISDYIGNIERNDIIDLMRTTAKRLRKNQDFPPAQGPMQ